MHPNHTKARPDGSVSIRNSFKPLLLVKTNRLIIDELILSSSDQMEVFRVIQIRLLCVQEDPVDRSVMS